MNKEKIIAISVCVVTFNQDKYIEQCLESIANQETDFEFEILVGDDASTDETSKIISKLAIKYPELIKPIIRQKNIGSTRNCFDLYNRAKGNLICHIDGDDYLLPGKLKQQHEVMMQNLDCTICAHNVIVVDQNNKIVNESYKNKNTGKYSLKDLYLDLPFFSHSSKMFRKIDGLNLNDYFKEDTLDIEIHIKQAKHGNIFYINKTLGAYRIGTGITQNPKGVNPLIKNGIIRSHEGAINEFSELRKILKNNYAVKLLQMSYLSIVAGAHNDYKNLIRKSIGVKIVSAVQIGLFLLSATPAIAQKIAQLRQNKKFKR